MRFSFFDITSSMNGVALFMPSSKSKDTRNISYCNIPWNEILPKVLKKDGKLYLAYTVRDLKHYIANHLFNVSFGDKASSIFLPASLFLNCHKNKHSFIFDTWEGALLRELFKKVDIDIVTAKSELYYDFNISGDYILSNLYVDLNSGEVYYHTMGDLLPVSLEYATLTSSLNDSFRNDSTLYSLRVSVSAKL